jgi:hypothetical protein
VAADALKDGTAASQSGGFGAGASDFSRGYLETPQMKTDRYDPEDHPATQEGDPMSFNPGVLGRPRGWAR